MNQNSPAGLANTTLEEDPNIETRLGASIVRGFTLRMKPLYVYIYIYACVYMYPFIWFGPSTPCLGSWKHAGPR